MNYCCKACELKDKDDIMATLKFITDSSDKLLPYIPMIQLMPRIVKLLDKQTNELFTEKVDIDYDLQQCQKHLKDSNSEILKLKEALKEAKATIKTLESTNNKLKDANAKAENKIQEKVQKRNETVKRIKSEHAEQIKELVNERDSYKTEVWDITEQNEELKEKVKSLKARIKESDEKSAWGWVSGLFSGGTPNDAQPSKKRRRS